MSGGCASRCAPTPEPSGAHGPQALLTRPMPRTPHHPLPGAPEPWAPSTMPPFRSRPPYVMSEMIAAEPAVAERLVRRLAKDAALDRVAAEIREAADAGRPVVTTGCGTSEHAAMAVAMLVSDALDLPAGREIRSAQALETLRRPLDSGLLLAVSHEGGTHATNEAIGAAKSAGATTALITVGPGSPERTRRSRHHDRGAGPQLVPHGRLPGAAGGRHGAGRETAPIAARCGGDPRAPGRQPGRARPGRDRRGAGRDRSDPRRGLRCRRHQRPRAGPQDQRGTAPGRECSGARDGAARPPRRGHPLDGAGRRADRRVAVHPRASAQAPGRREGALGAGRGDHRRRDHQ